MKLQDIKFHPEFELVTTTMGVVSIRNKRVNEIMHNPVGPWIEANQLYVEQSRLLSRLVDPSRLDEQLVLFDVGLGAAANSLAVLHCVASIPAEQAARRVQLISFEKDLELLHFALENAEAFSHFSGFEFAIAELLRCGFWRNDRVSWELRHGDFNSLIEAETSSAEIIFFDPYSPQVNSEMWSLDTFRKLRNKVQLRSSGGPILLTYSQATSVRTALLAAGFMVGFGSATGKKMHTTQAALSMQALDEPLGLRWLERWKRSHVPYPTGSTDSAIAEMRDLILGHPQFAYSLI